MADGKRWFKVWTSILSDPTFDELPNECAGIWVKLGALIAKHGCNGNITVTKQQFLKRTNLTENALPKIQIELKNVNVDILPSSNGNITVTFYNWKKYQEISDSYARVKKFRDKHLVTVDDNVTMKRYNETTEEKRREEKKKRKEESNDINTSFLDKLKENPAYKEIDIDKELSKMDAWLSTPAGRGRKKTSRFILNWLNRIDTTVKTKGESLADSYRPL